MKPFKFVAASLLIAFFCFVPSFALQKSPIYLEDGIYTVNGDSLLQEGTYKVTTQYPYAELIIRSDVYTNKTRTIELTNGKIELPMKTAIKEIDLALFRNDKIIISMPYGNVKFELIR
jgi:hypothetical protein